MNDDILSYIDWTGIAIVTLVAFMPVLLLFIYLCYRRYLYYQDKRRNDELIVRMAKEGQQLTPELIEAIRRDEKKQPQTADQAASEAYQKLCIGGALVVGGLVVLIRNREFAIIMIVVGLFMAAQGLALWLSHRNDLSQNPEV